MTEVETIAKSLTKVSREALTINAKASDLGGFRVIYRRLYPATITALERRGLITRTGWLTTLGEQVAAEIQGSSHDR